MGLRETMPPPSSLIRAVDLNGLICELILVIEQLIKLGLNCQPRSVTRASLINSKRYALRSYSGCLPYIFRAKQIRILYGVCLKTFQRFIFISFSLL